MSDVWEQAKKDLKLGMGEATYNTLLLSAELLKQEGDVYIIGVPSHSIRDKIEGHLSGAIDKALSNVAGKPISVRLKVTDSPRKPAGRVAKNPPPPDDEDLPGSVRDKRKPGRYYIDNRFIRGGYAAKVGPGGIAAYNVLVASADNDYQDCFPSYGKIAELGGMSKTQAKNKIKELEGLNIISVERRKNPNNPKLNDSNLFTLIDDKEWKKLK